MREEREIKRLITLAKILLVLMLVLVIIEFFSCTHEAEAATITGEQHLAGISYWLEQYENEYGHNPYTEDIELLAEVMYHENWHTDSNHKAAYYTGAVVLNRVKSKDFPNTVKSVIYQKGQYSTTHKFFTMKLPKECYDMAIKLLTYGAPDVPNNVVWQAMFPQGNGVWKKVNTDYFCYE